MEKYTIHLLLICVLLLSCKQEKADPTSARIEAFENLTEKTIETHDEVMADMGTLMDLSMAIDEHLRKENVPKSTAAQLTEAKTQLDEAHAAMMDWMKDYSTKFPYEAKAPTTEEDLDEKMPILQESYEGIQAVKEQTYEAIAIAEQLLSDA
ncbi:hypothetical protein [Nonlabens marinus]|uniref:Uncharacterized protein n=1 Tax=Nonlabens marinus S1-08 TaxID=1454201 RepID=W8VQ89_9FLAO|nr:hypothetical protein [Nonlabens marinus]BAO54935.1 hypothetical protein NMS_0926 [Nonlabens marinus S1-08]